MEALRRSFHHGRENLNNPRQANQSTRPGLSRRELPLAILTVVVACVPDASTGRTPQTQQSPRPPERPVKEAEHIEQEIWEMLPHLFGEQRVSALAKIDSAIALRRARQGEEHSDLIWPLSIKIELLRHEHSRESQSKAAAVGEARLALRRRALRTVPREVLYSIEELVDLYRFEEEVWNPDRANELRREARMMRERLEASRASGR